MENASKNEIISQLKRDLLLWEGFKRSDSEQAGQLGLGEIEEHFSDGVFPRGHIHELISYGPEAAVATNGFIAAITGRLIAQSGFCLWVSTKRFVFPPTLALFGFPPERVIFTDLRSPKEALWTIEEALKCNVLTAVIGEVPELSFEDSRRLQLAVEKSRVTGFIHRHKPRAENTTACVTRWKVTPLTSIGSGALPGLGFPCWDIVLQKVRNGQPGRWQLGWDGTFIFLGEKAISIPTFQRRKTG
jgi:protein ImuA